MFEVSEGDYDVVAPLTWDSDSDSYIATSYTGVNAGTPPETYPDVVDPAIDHGDGAAPPPAGTLPETDPDVVNPAQGAVPVEGAPPETQIRMTLIQRS